VATKPAQKKNPVQLAAIQAQVQIVGQIAGVFKTALAGGFSLACVYVVMEGLKSIVLASPESIKALSQVVANIHLNGIVGALVGLAGVSFGMYERKGKKRMVPGYAAARRKIEQHDPYHASSGLTESGDTPTKGE
jgi:hypothetical protein